MSGFHINFEKAAQKFPIKTAIIHVNNNKKYVEITYQQLNEHVNKLTECLNKYVTQNTCIGILLVTSNLHLPTSIFSIHKLGCAFYCIDQFSFNISTLKSIGIKFIITSKNAHILPPFCNKLDQTDVLELWQINDNNLINYNNISYIIQTSGTTGQNKIVKVMPDCINSNINSLRKIFKITEKDVILFNTPITFDPFIIELMLALTSGATLFIIDPEIKNNKQVFFDILCGENSKITFLQTVPSLFLSFPDIYITRILSGRTSLRILALGGENFPEKLVNFKEKNIKLFNLYGITEISCWASVEEINSCPVSLGNVLNDTIFQIRDCNNEISLNGELYIGSKIRVCLINDEDISIIKDVVFRPTGDLVKYSTESNKYFYVSRKNDIIKRFGIKINLNHINKLIYDITELISINIWDHINSKLLLFIILQENDKIVQQKIVDKLRIKLIHNLPAELNPDFIQIIPSIPITTNGKLDRKTLLNISNINLNATITNSVEFFEILYSKYFGISKYQIETIKNKSFIEMGGNSILAIQLIAEFDSLFKNNNSAELMGMLLNPSTSYLTYISLLNNLYYEPKHKQLKLNNEENDELLNKNDINVEIKWKYDLKACVDCTPFAYKHSSFGTLIASGSHANIFAIINDKGALVSQTIFNDAIEGTSCIYNNVAIIGCNDCCIYCCDIKSGIIKWKFLCGDSVKSTPVLWENQRIIFGSYDKHLYCLNIEDGSLHWKLCLNESIKSNVIIDGSNCYIATINGTFYCICITSKQIIWQVSNKIPIFSSPCLMKDENIILWADVKGFVNCYDVNNGTKVWQINTSNCIYSSIVTKNHRILFNSLDHNVYCYDINRRNFDLVFKINLGAQISSTPCIFVLNDVDFFTVFNNKGILYLFELSTGILRQKFELNNEVFSSPVFCENCIYVGCRDNHLYCIEIKF